MCGSTPEPLHHARRASLSPATLTLPEEQGGEHGFAHEETGSEALVRGKAEAGLDSGACTPPAREGPEASRLPAWPDLSLGRHCLPQEGPCAFAAPRLRGGLRRACAGGRADARRAPPLPASATDSRSRSQPSLGAAERSQVAFAVLWAPLGACEEAAGRRRGCLPSFPAARTGLGPGVSFGQMGGDTGEQRHRPLRDPPL